MAYSHIDVNKLVKQPLDKDAVFGEVPAARKFKKVNEVVWGLIKAANEDVQVLEERFATAKLNFNATVDATAKTIDLTLKPAEQRKDRFVFKDVEKITFNYGFSSASAGEATDLNADEAMFHHFMSKVLGFEKQYDESKLSEVANALDDLAFEHSYDEDEQVLTVTVKETASEFDFADDNATLVTALFPAGLTYTISFYDDAIILDEKFPNTDLTIALEDLVEAA